MKIPQLFTPLFFCLFGFFLTSHLLIPDAIASDRNLTTCTTAESYSTSALMCYTPTWPTTSNITQTSATFSWDVVYGAVSYSIQTRVPNGTWYNVPGSPTGYTSITVDWFLPNTTYQWRVRANCSGGEYSYWTSPITFTTEGGSCEAPSWLATTNITQSTATFDWSPVSGASSYSVQWRLAGGTWYNLGGGPWMNTWVAVGGLEPGTDYEWRVRSNCGYGMYSEWSYPESFTTLGYSCSTPTWLSTTYITETSATFNWDEVPAAQSYSVQIRLPNGSWSYVPGSPTTYTSITVYGLNPNTTYEWRVRANCGYNQYSNWSYPILFTTDGSSCQAPVWLYTTNITQTSATLDWSAVSGAVAYTLQWRYPGGTWYNVPGGPFSETWYTLTGLLPGTTYEWRVRSICYDWNYSPWSCSATFTTLGYSCNKPTWLSTTYITETSATFNWDAVPGAQSYSVEIRLPNGYWSTVQGSPTSYTSITVYGLYPNTMYEWRVRSNCGYGQYSYWTYPVWFTTLGASCHAPSWLYTTNITQTSATLDWDPVNGASSYSLQWRHPGGNWNNVYGGPFYQTWYTLTGLTPGTVYEWRVQSNCYNGQYSDWSYYASFVTLGYSCGKPTWLSTTNITETSATFNWDAIPGANSYSVQYRLPNGLWYDVPGSPTTYTSITLSGLNPNTTYEWRVRANCGYGNYSYWTSSVTFTTLGSSTCNPPTFLFTVDITETSAKLDWSAAPGAASYSIQWQVAGDSLWTDLAGGPFTETWTNLTGLQPGTAYKWRVKSNCYNGLMSDWSVNGAFLTLGNSCLTPTGLSTNNVTDTSATFSWTAVTGAQDYTVQTRLPNQSWNNAPGSPFAGTSATVTGFIPGTTYEWRVRANCITGNQSDWSSAVSFTTTGSTGSGAEDCAEATQLTVHTSCVNTSSSNIGATASTPAPVGWCPTNWYKDVWFKFTMPDVSNPVVTIRTTAGTLTDAVMEVYRGADCANLVYIFCEDDNFNGNGSTMPVISITGTANETIWVRVWGYAGTTGTFSICVFDYQSNNYVAPDIQSAPLNAGEPSGTFEKVTEVKGFANENDEYPLLRVSPNPANDVLNIIVLQTEDSKVSALVIHDISGQIVARNDYPLQDIEEFSEQINVSELIPGIYILQVITTDGIITEKISIVD